MDRLEGKSGKELVVLDVSNVKSEAELHRILKEKLDFPDFYGMNWSAFWDAITGLVELPETLIFEGWESLRISLPTDSEILKQKLDKRNEMFPSWKSIVVYK